MIVNDPILPKQYMAIGNLVELDSSTSKNGIISFTEKPFKAPKPNEIKRILAQIFLESGKNSSIQNMLVSELY